MKLLSENDIFRHFGSAYGHRGDSYQRSRRVLKAALDSGSKTVSGDVQGTETRPYQVLIQLTEDGASIQGADCSCPMGGFCKHSAALMLEAVRKGILRELLSETNLEPMALPETKVMLDEQELQDKSEAHLPTSPGVRHWISELRSSCIEQPELPPKLAPSQNFVLYTLGVNWASDRLALNVSQARRLKNGSWGKENRLTLERILTQSASYITDEDCELATLFMQNGRSTFYSNTFPENPELCRIILELLLSSRRCFWKEIGNAPLDLGMSKEGSLYWHTEESGRQKLRVRAPDDGDIAVIAGVGWYVNPQENIFGPLVLPLPPKAVRAVLNAPMIEPQEAQAVAASLSSLGASIPPPVCRFEIKTIALDPKPKLLLLTRPRYQYYSGFRHIPEEKETVAVVSFDYGKASFKAHETECRILEGNEITIYRRDATVENRRYKDLWACGLQRTDYQNSGVTNYGFPEGGDLDWLNFYEASVPTLQKLGWEISFDKSFSFEVVVPHENWSAETSDSSDFWFSLDLGITVDGKKVPLLPIIHQALMRISGKEENPLAELKKLSLKGKFFAPLPDGRHAALPYERVKALVEILLELFDRQERSRSKGAGQVSLPQVMALANNLGLNDHSWCVGKHLKEVLNKIKNFRGVNQVTLPENFRAQLRSYQSEGVDWLNFLREFKLGGILADDMGLGKTVQALAHISVEKNQRHVEKAFLVVCPTSVLPNWLSEIEKFTPDLKATALWGPDRACNFDDIETSDIVLTTYPLVPRDINILRAHKWQAVFLDEAQVIKNPLTQVAQAVGKLDCQYRVCLTGTPVENHLGELWSQFNFLMPGFLKDLPTFTRTFRTPIEKQQNRLVQQSLASRIRPLLLRRTKELVAAELPEKTEIIKHIELEGDQRDLYETVRLAMYSKVKEALASKGLAKSQIVILDALLKLRQVCCDPRLVSMPRAETVQTSAKLELLMEMLEELLEEGRKVLLFSQFTSMLDLIVPELERRKIGFVEIRGDTRDRATPVKRFQNGDVPIFLLSLKAGGTGLNLTAADTVIHYDPWWNPAVENQATDRAHRIGQNKSVFVFKLIARGTIEERMLELQERKKAIAEGIYSENTLPSKLTAEDIHSLFRPLS